MILLFILTILVSLFIINHSRTEFIGCFDNKFLRPIRGILALLICWHHISLECISYGAIYQEFRLWGVIVGQFFFISGYGLFYSWSHKNGYLKSFLSRSFKKLFVPFAVVLSLYVLKTYFNGCMHGNLLNMIIPYSGITYLPKSWFVYELMLLYIMFYYIFRLKIDVIRKLSVLLLICVLLIAVLVILGYGSNWYVSTLAFPIGMIYSYKEKYILHNFKLCIYGIISVILMLFVCYFVILNIFKKDVLYPMLNISLPLLLPMIAYKCKYFKSTVLDFFGSISYEVYLVHGIFVIWFLPYKSHSFVYIFSVYASSLLIAYVVEKIDKWLISKFLK